MGYNVEQCLKEMTLQIQSESSISCDNPPPDGCRIRRREEGFVITTRVQYVVCLRRMSTLKVPNGLCLSHC